MIARAASSSLLPVLRELIDEAQEKKYAPGVLGVRIELDGHDTRTFTHDTVPVRVEPCVSALAVREALLSQTPGEWMIVLTDRSDEDLGAGVLSRLIGHRLRSPDPWTAVRHRFAATGLDPALSSRDVAVGLLAATPPSGQGMPGGWPPAPGGVLTRDHAFGAVAAAHLGLTDPVVDTASILTWSTNQALAARISALRTLAGNAVTDAALNWLADRTGTLAQAMRHLLSGGEAYDAVPLGLVAGLLASARDTGIGEEARIARDALIRMETLTGEAVLPSSALGSWAAESAAVITGMLGDQAVRASAGRLLARADRLLTSLRAEGLAGGSDLLPSGLTRRLTTLAGALRAATVRGIGESTDQPVIDSADLDNIERAWARAAAHQHADPDDARIRAFHATVRLTRWLARDTTANRSLPDLLRRHATQDAWADSAVNDATAGVADPDQGAGIEAVLTAARARRAAHDTTFAHALATYTKDDTGTRNRTGSGSAEVLRVEDLLPDVVLPLAHQAPVLLLVLDGMSAAVCAEIMTNVLSRARDGWAEALVNGQPRRAAAIAVLPTLTETSRASLLSGVLTTGGQDTERAGYAALTRAKGLPDAPLFHKKPLDTSRPGHALADDVSAAIDNADKHRLVTCVLNTVDDALDRSDAAGIEWSAETVRHLRPLLERARDARRVVILTADHGHVIERRHGRQRKYQGTSSTRSRSATPPPEADEVLVEGQRVLKSGGSAVLAVDEELRYGPLKSGYHGGASPAEAVVPVAVLVPGPVPEGAKLTLAPPQEPAWWIDPVLFSAPLDAPVQRFGRVNRPESPAPASPAADLRKRPQESMATLFDEEPVLASEPVPSDAGHDAGPAPEAVAKVVFKSPVFTAHRKRIGRVTVTDDQAEALLEALLSTPSRRLAKDAAAAALGVPVFMLRGAVSQVQQLLNIDGAAVIRVDADGSTVVVDISALEEQYGIKL
jgi:hypothetical protein